MFGGMFGGGSAAEDDLFALYSIDFNKKYGEGGYGATFAAKDTASSEALACKIIDTRRMRPDAIKKECQILEVLSHPNIIAVKGHGVGKGKHAHLYFIFMELAGGGELFDQVIDRGANAMPEPVARGFFNQMLGGVAYCHLAGVAHRDLKLENVLLNAAGVVKLIDFGLSHVYPRHADQTIDRSRPLRDVCGSKSYAAPEVLGGNGYDGYAADMWSLGVCLFAMLSGFFPLDEASANDWRYTKLVDMQKGRRSTVASVYSWYKRSAAHLSSEVVDLLDRLLLIEPAKRLTMHATQQHPWVMERKFDAGDQGAYNANDIVGEDGPVYRGGLGCRPAFDDEAVDDMAFDDDAPVYRSLGDGAPAEPPALPGLKRQHGKSHGKWASLMPGLGDVPPA